MRKLEVKFFPSEKKNENDLPIKEYPCLVFVQNGEITYQTTNLVEVNKVLTYSERKAKRELDAWVKTEDIFETLKEYFKEYDWSFKEGVIKGSFKDWDVKVSPEKDSLGSISWEIFINGKKERTSDPSFLYKKLYWKDKPCWKQTLREKFQDKDLEFERLYDNRRGYQTRAFICLEYWDNFCEGTGYQAATVRIDRGIGPFNKEFFEVVFYLDDVIYTYSKKCDSVEECLEFIKKETLQLVKNQQKYLAAIEKKINEI